MLKRQINVLQSDGTWGTEEISVDNFDSHEYRSLPYPEDRLDIEETWAEIAKDFKCDKPVKVPASNRRRNFKVALSYFDEFGTKRLVYRHSKSSDLKVYDDGTWDYSAIEIEDK